MNLDNSGRPRKQKKYLMFLITPECHLMMFRGEKVFFFPSSGANAFFTVVVGASFQNLQLVQLSLGCESETWR